MTSPPGYENSRHLTLGGVRTHVQTWEPAGGARATVVGSHHFYGSAQTFHRLGPLLVDQGIRLLAFDRVGFGLTERPRPAAFIGQESPYTRAFAVGQIRELLDQLGIDRAIVAGTSMGGVISCEFGLAHPDRTQHVVAASSPLTADAAAPPGVRRLLRARVVEPMGVAAVRRLGREVDHARVGKSFHRRENVTHADVEAHANFQRGDDWARGLWWKFVADTTPTLPDDVPQLATLGVPLTAVGATHDRTVHPRYAQRLAVMAGGSYVEIACGHLVHVEGAHELAQVLTAIADGSA